MNQIRLKIVFADVIRHNPLLKQEDFFTKTSVNLEGLLIFRQGDTIKDSRNENRWRVEREQPQSFPYTRTFVVADASPGMDRRLLMETLDYSILSSATKDWDVRNLRNSFEELVKAATANLTFFPEIIDYFYFSNLDDSLDPSLQDSEPAIVYALPSGKTMAPLHKNDQRLLDRVRSLCLHVVKTLRVLHNQGLVVRQLPLSGLRSSMTTFKQYFTGFQTLCRMQTFSGYNPHEPGFHPFRKYAAPECFEPDGYLSPATDVYALGRLLLEYLGLQLGKTPLSQQDLKSTLSRLPTDETWNRFFQLALQINPKNRFQNCQDVDEFVSSHGTSASSKNRRYKNRRKTNIEVQVERPGLPQAALIVAGDLSVGQGNMFHYDSLIADLQKRYSLFPRIHFVKKQQNMENAFFHLLENQFRFELQPYEKSMISSQLISSIFADKITGVGMAIIIGDTKNKLTQLILNHSEIKKLNINLVVLGGTVPQGVKPTDGTQYVRPKRR